MQETNTQETNMKTKNWLRNSWQALSLAAALLTTNVSAAYTPEQTAQTWVSALKRNDVNTLMLLALTPDRYLEHREQVRELCYVKSDSASADWGVYLSLNQADPRAALFAMISPFLAEANSHRDAWANDMQGMLDELLNNSKDPLDADQAAAVREVAMATKAWALRTDFSDEKRLRRAIDVFVTEAQAIHQVFGACDQYDSAKLVQKLDPALRAIKGIMKAYDFDIDQALSQINISNGGKLSKADGRSIAKVRIGYRLFEARGSSILELYQVGDQWFFWRESFF